MRRPELTVEVVVEAAKRHRERTGRWPSVDYDGAADFGYPRSWSSVDYWCRKHGTSLSKLLVSQGLRSPRGVLSEEAIVEAAKRHHTRTGMYPGQKSEGASEDFGYDQTWSNTNVWLHLRGSSLRQLLDSLGMFSQRRAVGPQRKYKRHSVWKRANRRFRRVEKA